MSGAGIDVRELSVAFGGGSTGSAALDGVTLEMGFGERIALVGRSGSGKSTLALALGGLLPDSPRVRGSLRVGGDEMVGAPASRRRQVRGRRLGFVFQDPHGSLNPVLRVGRQLNQVLREHHPGVSDLRERGLLLLEEVGLHNPRRVANLLPGELSGGMAQRVAIALALAGEPEMLVADEATTSLDRPVERRIVDLLLSLSESRGAGVLFVTHDLPLAESWTERAVVLERGRVVDDLRRDRGTPRSRVSPATRALLQAHRGSGGAPSNSRGGSPESGAGSSSPATAPPTGVAASDGPAVPASPPPPSSPLLRLRDVTVDFGPVRAVDGVDLEIVPGETVALIGASGSGKSTLARAVIGAVRSRGSIELEGTALARWMREDPRGVRARLQLLFQNSTAALSPRIRVGAAIREVLRLHGHPDDELRELLESVHLPVDLAARYPHELSGGERQRVALARALAVRPRLLILDEPITSLDPVAASAILDLIDGLKGSRGLTYVFIAHDLSRVARVADRVVVLDRGRVVESGETSEVLAGGSHAATRALVAAEPDFGGSGGGWISAV